MKIFSSRDELNVERTTTKKKYVVVGACHCRPRRGAIGSPSQPAHQQQSAATSLRAVTGQSRTRCSRVRTWQSCTKPGSTRQFSRKQSSSLFTNSVLENLSCSSAGMGHIVSEAFQATTETQYQNTFPTDFNNRLLVHILFLYLHSPLPQQSPPLPATLISLLTDRLRPIGPSQECQ